MRVLLLTTLVVVFAVVLPILVWLFASRVTESRREKRLVDHAVEILRQRTSPLKRETLENGMICLVMEDHSAPAVSIQVWVGSGSIHEDRLLGAGLSHAIEHMIFKGTDTMGPVELSRLINNAGGDINAYTWLDRTVFHADLPSSNWKIGVKVLSDALKGANFPAGEWQKERDVILREFAMGKDDAGREINKLVLATAFTTHPYRHPVIGHAEIFKKITRDDLLDFFRKNYTPDNMITVVVGDINAQEVMAEIKAAFAAVPRAARPPVVMPQEPRQIAARTARQSGKYNISRLEWVYHTVPISHPDAPALSLLAEIAGNGRSSRLVKSIREDQKLVQEISVWSFTPREAGLFGISAEFKPEDESRVLAAIQAEIDKCIRKGFTREEIYRARRQVLTGILSEVETMKGQAESYASGELSASDPFFSQRYLEKLAELTPSTLQKTAAKYLDRDNLTIAVLCPEGYAVNAAPPASAATIAVPVHRKKLANGITLLMREDHRLPFVFMCAAVKGGLLSETDSDCGITRLMSDLLVRGTASRTGEDIARLVDSRGGMLDTFSGYNSFGLRAKCLSQDVSVFADLLADCLTNPAFPDGEVAKQKTMQISAIDQEQEKPFSLARESLRLLLFPGHPYRFSQLGTRESVGGITRRALVDKFRREMSPDNLVLSVFGDITPAQIEQLVARKFGTMSTAGHTRPAEPAKPRPTLPARNERLAPKEQAIILAGFPGLDLFDPRTDPITVLVTAMSGLSSELGIAVREKKGLAYYVGAFQQTGIHPGAFVMYAGTLPEKVGEVEKMMRQEMVRVTSRGITGEELERAKKQIISDHEMALQDNLDTAMKAAVEELVGLGYEHAFNVRERISKITGDDVRNAAGSILSTDKMAVSIVLPEKTTGEKR